MKFSCQNSPNGGAASYSCKFFSLVVFSFFYLALFACGTSEDVKVVTPAPGLDEASAGRSDNESGIDLRAIVAEVEDFIGRQMTSSIRISDSMEQNDLGVCITYLNSDAKSIKLNSSLFTKGETVADSTQIVSDVLYHEAGHCEIGLPHDFEYVYLYSDFKHPVLIDGNSQPSTFTVTKKRVRPRGIMYPYMKVSSGKSENLPDGINYLKDQTWLPSGVDYRGKALDMEEAASLLTWREVKYEVRDVLGGTVLASDNVKDYESFLARRGLREESLDAAADQMGLAIGTAQGADENSRLSTVPFCGGHRTEEAPVALDDHS